MPIEKFKRKLTAVFSADVVGYSRLMSVDEDTTVKTLTTYREIMASLIKQHRGRVVDSPGDNVLAEFASVVDATQCAMVVQKEFQSRNADLPEERRMVFRIGINLGDVIEEDERIYGEGVNVAARLEALCDPGGICISKTTFDHIESKLPLGYEYMGEQTVRNIPKPISAYRVMMEPRVTGRREKEIERASKEKMAYPIPDKPSIAVLPFTNMSGDPSQDYIGDGFSENVISALSVSSQMFVIARNSTFTYKGKPVKVQQVAEELGVQYVLEGSIQKSGDRLRLTAQLIDALSGYHLWSEKYDREMKDLFDLQDEITKKIVVSVGVELTGGEDVRVYAKSTDNLEAWKHWTKGIQLHTKYNPENIGKAREHFKTALKLDPGYVSALTFIGYTHLLDATLGWSDSPLISMKRSFEFAQKALKMNERDASAHTLLGTIYCFQRQHEKAIAEGKRAITLNPNFAVAYAELANTMHFSGRFDEAITLTLKAFRLSPNLPNIAPIYLFSPAGSYIFLGRYEKALEICKQMEELARTGNCPAWWAAERYSLVYQEMGREEEARRYMAEALKLNPNLSLEWFKMHPYKNPAHLQRQMDAAHKAGMPEKAPGAMP